MQKPQKTGQNRKSQARTFEFEGTQLSDEFPLHVHFDCPTMGDWRNGLLHFHKGLEIGLCLEGTGTFTIEDRNFRFRSGDMVAIGPGLLHTAISDPEGASRWDWIFPDVAGLLASRVEDVGILDLEPFSSTASPALHLEKDAHPKLHALLTELSQTYRGNGSRDALRALLILIMSYLKKVATRSRGAPRPLSSSSSGLQRIVPALKMINTRFGDPLTVDTLAAECCMSARGFFGAFERTMRETPHAYVTRFRISQACGALAGTQAPITRIALDCGFESVSSFNRNFRAVMGKTPLEFRRGGG